MTITNAIGEIILMGVLLTNSGTKNLDMSDLSRGVYFILVIDREKTKPVKLIVSRQ